jgi:hypothetical protein
LDLLHDHATGLAVRGSEGTVDKEDETAADVGWDDEERSSSLWLVRNRWTANRDRRCEIM